MGRVGLQQRVIPSYRAAFFDALARACPGGLSVFAGRPLDNEGIASVDRLQFAQYFPAKNHHFRDPGSPLFMCWQGGFTTWLEAWQPEVLIVEANPRYLATRQAISRMHRRHHKVIGWGLGAPQVGGLLAGLRNWERLSFLRTLDAIVAYSQLGAGQYQQLGLSIEKVYVASNAAAPAPSGPPLGRSNQQEPLTVLFVGRLQSRKRLDLLLKACSSLPEALKPNLVIIGDGPTRGEYEDLAEQVYPQAQFLGALHGTELEPYLSMADLFVLPGTGGLAIQQAMSFALPIIVARGDGTQDDLVRPENGWQIPPDDPQALVHALSVALSDLTRLRQMGLASYRIVTEEINIDRMVEVFLQAIAETVA